MFHYKVVSNMTSRAIESNNKEIGEGQLDQTGLFGK